ncbi:MAG TPA: GNAT family N-acetyltransferase [Hyphomicrobiaceae bacterium]|nr:GNAT family N-acetyltransferase [Hyphomicrobiaceae bacterium]
MAAPDSRLRLVEPSLALLPGYADALSRGWSPNNVRDVSAEHLRAIRADAPAFLASLLSQSGTITLPDGREVPKLPNRVRWMWDGEFAGQIGLRWQPGTDALPPHALGHVGYAVVPWKRRRGYATEALRLMLDDARAVGLRSLEITTDKGNFASGRVIEANHGYLVEEFVNRAYGDGVRLRYRIDLGAAAGERREHRS